MRVTGCALALYRLPLDPPLRLRHTLIRERRGALVRLEDSDGRCGFGEIAPFPSPGRDALLRMIRTWRPLQTDLFQRTTFDLSSLDALLAPLDTLDLKPAMRIGVQSALVTLAAAIRGTTPAAFLASQPLPCFTVNRLVTDVNALAAYRFSERQPVEVIKIKVGNREWREERAALLRFLERCPRNVRIRLDANRSWQPEQARAFLSGIDHTQIAYIEEPLAEEAELEALYRETGVAYAWDESVLTRTFPDRFPDGLAAVVLKPTFLGDMRRVRAWALKARTENRRVVFTSVFESGLGLRNVAVMASAWGSPHTAMGLGTARWFADDTIVPRFVVENNRYCPGNEDVQLNNRVLEWPD